MLQSIAHVENESYMLTWNYESLMDAPEGTMIPLNITQIELFEEQEPCSLITMNSVVKRNQYNPQQFQFFMRDERIVQSLVYSSTDNPS